MLVLVLVGCADSDSNKLAGPPPVIQPKLTVSFPEMSSIDSSVYKNIQKTCSERWNLKKMKMDTFNVRPDQDEFVVECDRIEEGKLYRWVIRANSEGKWINDGRAKKNNVEQKVNAELSETEIIRTEERLTTLLGSIGAGEVAKNVTLVGKLDLGSNPKLDPSELIIGKTSVNFGHYLDKDKYNGQTVLVKADIRNPGKGEGSQVSGHMIVNVQHVEIIAP